jgi:hypothetical protein
MAGKQTNSLGPFRVRAGANVTDLAHDLNRNLAIITTILNDRMGFAGPVILHDALDAKGNTIRNVAPSTEATAVATVAQLTALQAALTALQTALAQLAQQVDLAAQGQDATLAPPAVGDASAIGPFDGHTARQQHTHQGVNRDGAQSISGLKTFSRGAGAPFAVVSGAAKVAFLDADLLDGLDSTAFATAAGLATLAARVTTLETYHWVPLVGGEPAAPELIFADSELIWELRPVTEE